MNTKMLKIDSKSKQTPRNPLREVYNGVRSSKSVKIKKVPPVSQHPPIQNDASLDRLLLVHSDLSSLLRQTDELVVQALKLDSTSRNGLNELESFTQVLSNIQSSLKPWVPRIQKALSNCSDQSDCEEDSRNDIDSPERIITESRVSLSPLVSWRGDFANEGGTQLFLLTPMPKLKSISSKVFLTGQRPSSSSSSSIIAITTNTNDDLIESVVATPNKTSLVVMTTPYKKPKKSCVVLEPISESTTTPKNNAANRTSTPFPVRTFSDSFESSSGDEDEASKNLALKYSELMGCGIVQPEKVENERKDLDSSPYWFFSPPKTCLVMEPQEDDYSKSVDLDFAAAKSIDASIVMEKQHCGESTLKKELWNKFEDASDEIHPIRYIPPMTTQKGFLDRLDEAL